MLINYENDNFDKKLCSRTSQRGKIMSLEVDPIKGAIGGLIYNLDTGERAIFYRNNVYLFGTCIAKMDLNYVLTMSDKVKLVTEIMKIDEVEKFKEKYGGLEVYKRAKIVWVGETPKWSYVNNQELKFSVDRNLTGLQQYLAKRNISIDMFTSLVNGNYGPQDSTTRATSYFAGNSLVNYLLIFLTLAGNFTGKIKNLIRAWASFKVY